MLKSLRGLSSPRRLHKHSTKSRRRCPERGTARSPSSAAPSPRHSVKEKFTSSRRGLSEYFFKHKNSCLENKSGSPSPPHPHLISPALHPPPARRKGTDALINICYV